MKTIGKVVPVTFILALLFSSLSFAREISSNVGISTTSTSVVDNVVISTASTSVGDIYKPKNLRDPMVTSSVSTSQTKSKPLVSNLQQVDVSSFTIKNLVLTGIIEFSDRKKEALLRDKLTGAIYVFKGGFLYDVKKKRVPGVAGSIKGKQVVLINNNDKNTPMEFMIKDPKDQYSVKE